MALGPWEEVQAMGLPELQAQRMPQGAEEECQKEAKGHVDAGTHEAGELRIAQSSFSDRSSRHSRPSRASPGLKLHLPLFLGKPAPTTNQGSQGPAQGHTNGSTRPHVPVGSFIGRGLSESKGPGIGRAPSIGPVPSMGRVPSYRAARMLSLSRPPSIRGRRGRSVSVAPHRVQSVLFSPLATALRFMPSPTAPSNKSMQHALANFGDLFGPASPRLSPRLAGLSSPRSPHSPAAVRAHRGSLIGPSLAAAYGSRARKSYRGRGQGGLLSPWTPSDWALDSRPWAGDVHGPLALRVPTSMPGCSRLASTPLGLMRCPAGGQQVRRTDPQADRIRACQIAQHACCCMPPHAFLNGHLGLAPGPQCGGAGGR